MKIAAMFVEQNFPEGKEVSTIRRHENFPSRSRRFVPVVIERYKSNGLMEKLKFQVSSKMTVSQLVCLLRRRMQLRPSQGFHLLYSKGKMAVMMSQRLGRISSEYKDSSGVLSFTFAAQTTFGCPVPRIQPVKSKFPGLEPNPFGAPEPSHWNDETVVLEFMGAEPPSPPTNDMNSLSDSFLSSVFPADLFPPSPPPTLGAPEPSHWSIGPFVLELVEAGPPPPPTYDMHSLFINFVLSLFPANHHFAPPPPPTFSVPTFTIHVNGLSLMPTHNNFPPHNWTFAFSPEPMEVSEENPSPSSPPELLPLASLIQSLNHLVPPWHIHLLSPVPIPVQPAAEYAPLVNSLNQVIQSLQNHVPSVVYLGMAGPPPTYHPLQYDFMPGSLANQACHTVRALDMANLVLSGLSDPSNVPVEEGELGMVQLYALTQYFHKAAQSLHNQAGGGPLPYIGPLDS